jgi:hypothetical protein
VIDNRKMVDLATIATSSQLTGETLDEAVASVGALKTLFVRVAEVAEPEQGWARLLKVVARAAHAPWLEGDLQVEFTGDEERTRVELYSVLGIGIRERLFSPCSLAVPIDEFQRAVVLTPDIVAPLRAHQGRGRLTLAAGQRVRSNDVPDFEVEEMAKGDGERITAPPPPLEIADPDDPLD